MIIALIGNVFSPYYARKKRRGEADPLDHAALNVAVYGRKRNYWSMTERRRHDLARTSERLMIGPSNLSWADGVLTIEIDETTAPFPRPMRGRVRVRPSVSTSVQFELDPHGRHRWWPIAPLTVVDVDFEQPKISWSGHGYLDANFGDVPLERDFVRWDWARGRIAGETVIVYDVTCRDGENREFAMSVDGEGNVHGVPILARAELPLSAWRIARGVRADLGRGVRVVRRLEDGPFYARSLIATQWFGQQVEAMQESLSLDRFSKPWVRALLPFRMPRSIR